jgi:DNA-binding transcriptional regulator GbsR (MarR family)
MKDVRIPFWERQLHARELVTEFEVFRSNVSSVVPELMSAALVQEAGFGVSFIPHISGSLN